MITEHQVACIYQHGWKDEDIRELRAGLVLVEPVRPPEKTLGGIDVSPALQKMPGQACLLYRVIKVGPPDTSNQEPLLAIEPGDVVVTRNAMLDPIHHNRNVLVIHHKHILAKVG